MTKLPKSRPTVEQLDAEISHIRERNDFRGSILATIRILVVVSAITVLLAMLWLPILRMYGDSMAPTLQDEEVVITLKTGEFTQGDIIAFYYNNKILVKRVIAEGGDEVTIDENGTVFVNDVALDEPYLTATSSELGNITYPYEVPEGFAFVLGDHRQTSYDSRFTEIGPVSIDQVVGRVVFRVWPLSELGSVK